MVGGRVELVDGLWLFRMFGNCLAADKRDPPAVRRVILARSTMYSNANCAPFPAHVVSAPRPQLPPLRGHPPLCAFPSPGVPPA